MTSGVPRGGASPSRIGVRIDPTPLWRPARLFPWRRRRGRDRYDLWIPPRRDLPDRQERRSIPGRAADRGRGTVASFAIVLRVTKGMLGAVASLAPDPTLTVGPAIPLESDVPVASRLGTPVRLPGCMLDIPPEPIIENDVGIAAPPVEPQSSRPRGEWNHNNVSSGSQHDHTKVGYDRQDRSSSSQTCKSKWNFRSGFIL